MKVGDVVTHTNSKDSASWRVVEMKTDSRACWIRLEEPVNEVLVGGIWHDARYFEVMEQQK
jgi:hypothetical protein